MNEFLRLLADFGESLILLLALVLLYGVVGLPLLQRAERFGALALGALFGAIAAVSLPASVAFASGATIGAGPLILLAASAFGGPWCSGAALGLLGIAVLATWPDGSVAMLGLAVTASALGTGLYLRWWRRGATPVSRDFLIGGLLLAGSNLPWQLATLPLGLAGEPILAGAALYPAGALLLGALLAKAQRQRAALTALAALRRDMARAAVVERGQGEADGRDDASKRDGASRASATAAGPADVVAVQQHAAMLEAQATLLQATVDSLGQGLSVIDAERRLVAWNRRFLDLFGLPAETIRKGMAWSEVADLLSERGGVDPYGAALRPAAPARSGESQRFEVYRGGQVIEIRRNPVPGGGCAALYSDISDLKAREARFTELAQRNASLAAAVDATSNGVIVTDPNLPGNPIVFVNPAFSRITGYAADEAVGRSCRLLQGKDTDLQTIERMRRAIAARRPIHVTIRNYRKDGRTFWTELSLNPVFDDRDQLVYFVGIQTDVTDRVRAEEALRRSERDLREQVEINAATLDALPAQVALLDAAGRVRKVNRRWSDAAEPEGDEVHAGGRPGIAVGRDYVALLEDPDGDYGEEAPVLGEGLRAVLAGEQAMFAQEYRIDAWPQPRWFKFIAAPVSREENRGAVVMHIDITDRIGAEEALRAAKEQAELANRSKSEFLANVSHELRTPLNAIIGFSEIMKTEMFGPLGRPQYQEYAQDIHDSGVHLLSIISDILDLSKIEAGKFDLHETDVRLPELIQSCLRLVKERAKAGKLTLKAHVAETLPALHADERAVKQILINLLSNAVKFTPAGGRISVEARLCERGDFLLTVADTGIGIAKGDIDKAMAAFRQVESPLTRKYAGTGLGLPLVRLFAELHGGSMQLESEVGVGTRVTVRFPQHRNVMAA